MQHRRSEDIPAWILFLQLHAHISRQRAAAGQGESLPHTQFWERHGRHSAFIKPNLFGKGVTTRSHQLPHCLRKPKATRAGKDLLPSQ